MTDFSHLHALEERAVSIQRNMMAAKKDVQWRSQAAQLFQTEQEIADERTMKGVAKRRVVAEKFHISITYVSYLWSGKFRKVSESVGGNNAGN